MKQSKILIIDENETIHESFHKIFSKKPYLEMNNIDNIFEDTFSQENEMRNLIAIDSAYNEKKALAFMEESIKNNNPYALSIIDIRISSALQGIETMNKIWNIDASLPIIIYTARMDHSLKSIYKELKHPNNFLILNKPSSVIEIKQLVIFLINRWHTAPGNKRCVPF